MSALPQLYRDTTDAFLDVSRRAPASDRGALIQACVAELETRYHFKGKVIEQFMDDLTRRATRMTDAEFSEAAFKAWLAVVLPQEWVDDYAVDTNGAINVVSII